MLPWTSFEKSLTPCVCHCSLTSSNNFNPPLPLPPLLLLLLQTSTLPSLNLLTTGHASQVPVTPHRPLNPSTLLLHDDGLDVLGFFQAKRAYNANKRRWDARSPEKAKRPFTPRKNYGRKDPRTSEWYMDYVLDAGKTFRDPTHRDGKLFRNRFLGIENHHAVKFTR